MKGQLHQSSGQLVAMLPAYEGQTDGVPDRLFLVDPRTGAVSAPSLEGVGAPASVDESAGTR